MYNPATMNQSPAVPAHSPSLRDKLTHESCTSILLHAQRMITAHNHVYRAVMEHNHRAAVVMDLANGGSMKVVEPRLDVVRVQWHAWLMFAAFGLVLPWGVVWAR